MPPKLAADGERSGGAFSAGLDLLDLICMPVSGERTEDAVRIININEYIKAVIMFENYGTIRNATI